MLLIHLMRFIAYHLPILFVQLREVGIGLLGLIIHKREIESVGLAKRLAIDGFTTYDKHLLVLSTGSKCFIKRRENLCARERDRLAGEHHVSTIGKSALGERLKSLASHHNGVTSGEGLKALQVIGKPIEQLVVIAYGSIPGYSCNQTYHAQAFSLSSSTEGTGSFLQMASLNEMIVSVLCRPRGCNLSCMTLSMWWLLRAYILMKIS